MARNRMIKPDFWGDEKLSELSLQARLLYIGTWNFSDDFGVVKGHPSWLKNNIFPYDDINIKEFESWLNELIKLKRLFPFTEDLEKYFFIAKFLEHQKINRPSKELRNPKPPANIFNSHHPHESFNESSVNAHNNLTPQVKLKEVKLNKSRSAGIFEFIDPKLLKRVGIKWPKCYQWIMKSLKHNKNENAIIHVLKRIDGIKSIHDYYAFATKVLNVESGNYNEQEFSVKEAQRQKQELKQHLDSIGEKI